MRGGELILAFRDTLFDNFQTVLIIGLALGLLLKLFLRLLNDLLMVSHLLEGLLLSPTINGRIHLFKNFFRSLYL